MFFFTVSVKGRLDAYGKCYCIIPRVCLSVKIYWRWISLIQVIEIYLLSVSYRIPSAFLDLLILALGQMFIKVCFVILFCIFLINVKEQEELSSCILSHLVASLMDTESREVPEVFYGQTACSTHSVHQMAVGSQDHASYQKYLKTK